MAITADGKPAVTHYRVLQRFKHYTYVECVLETGRTHQIRVHMASIGHPLLGDEVYGRRSDKYKCEGQCLHAMTLGFHHPRTGEYIEVNAPLPPYFEHLLAVLESRQNRNSENFIKTNSFIWTVQPDRTCRRRVCLPASARNSGSWNIRMQF